MRGFSGRRSRSGARIGPAGALRAALAVAATALALTACGTTQTGEFVPTPAEPVELQFRAVTETFADGGGSVAEETGDDPVTLEAVWEKVGSQAQELAESLTAPVVDPSPKEILAPFGELSAAEVAVLPPPVQFYVPWINCAQLGAREVEALDPDIEGVACNTPSEGEPVVKHLLGPAAIDSADLAGAQSQPDQTSTGYIVAITFTEAGSDKWAQLTAENINKQVAILVGPTVLTAPTVMSAIDGGAAELAGAFSKEEADLLARQIDAGAGG